jgi:16S rRNA (cytosine967-C5)-methyltransferase
MPEMTARLLALKVLNVYKPRENSLSDLLGSALKKAPSLKDHGFARDLVWGVARYLKSIDAYIAASADREKIDPEIRNILRLGLFQLLYGGERVPEYAAINESVELAKGSGNKAGSGFVNAVLRKSQALRKDGKLLENCDGRAERAALKHSYPLWMVKRWSERLGENEAEAFCQAGNMPPGITIRVNTARITVRELSEKLLQEGEITEPCRFSLEGLKFAANPALEKLDSFRQGLFWVQDEASQLAVRLLSVENGDEVLDLCCGGGTKSAQISALNGGLAPVTAVDNSLSRLERAAGNFRVLGINNVRLVNADIIELKDFFSSKVFIDAPCSGLGAIRRKPDIKWNRLESDVTERYPALQSRLLAAAAAMVKPGGTLVYCTCTTEREENEDVVEKFLEVHTEFSLAKPGPGTIPQDVLSPDGNFLKTYAHKHGTDSFFGAGLIKAG